MKRRIARALRRVRAARSQALIPLLMGAHEREIIKSDDLVVAFHKTLEILADLVCDVPLAPKHVAKMISTLIRNSAMPRSLLDKSALPADFLEFSSRRSSIRWMLALVNEDG